MKKITLNETKISILRDAIINKNFDKKKLNLVIKEIRYKLIKRNFNYLLIKNLLISKNNIKRDLLIFSKLLGHIISQNEKKEKILNITPSKKSNNLRKIARYHQTNIGGSFHSDGPQLIANPNILIMCCKKNTKMGGETVLVDIGKIFKYLKKNKKKIPFELTKNFLFERRGFKKNSVLKKPIFQEKKNYFNFRYLREYIEQGYRIKKLKIPENKIKALNILDNQMLKIKNQHIEKLKEGDAIIINNHITAHGRKTFKILKNNPRLIYRTWIN